MRTIFLVVAAATAGLGLTFSSGAPAGENGGAPPKVREERPRLILRSKAWDGPSVERLKGWMNRPEYQASLGKLGKSEAAGALRYLVLADEAAGKSAVAWLKGLKHPDSRPPSPSYEGEDRLYEAAAYDWLRGHPDLAKEEDRKGIIAYFEWWGDYFKAHNSPGCVPFYCRNSAAALGLASIAIAIHGDSPKAADFLAHAYKDFTENIGTIRQAEDGATGGANYGYIHQFGANAEETAVWRSGTDWDAAKWIQEKQGNWLERQMLWQMWATYPNGWFWKEGDVWDGAGCKDKHEYTLAIMAISDMYKNGYGRAHFEAMLKRWGMDGCHEGWRFLWFYLFNNPDVPTKPLDGLGRTDVFSPKLHAYVCWRDSWKDDATVVHFKAGDNVDHHGTWDTGKFTIFSRGAPLAIKNGYYKGYKSAKHMYYKSPWSANVVIFDGPKSHGWQPGMPDLDGFVSYSAWRAKRDTIHPVSGLLLASESNDKFARALADLSGSTHPDKSTWLRELVFLDYKYLLVLDRVKPGAGVKTRWILNSMTEPKIDADKRLTTIDNGKGRLFCQTLLPEGAKVEKVGGGGKGFVHKNQKGDDVIWDYSSTKPEQMLGAGRFDVVPADPGAECVYLHVLFPTGTETAAMPGCSVKKDGESYTVKVAELEYTFKPVAGK
jgi:hypothetical protein